MRGIVPADDRQFLASVIADKRLVAMSLRDVADQQRMLNRLAALPPPTSTSTQLTSPRGNIISWPAAAAIHE